MAAVTTASVSRDERPGLEAQRCQMKAPTTPRLLWTRHGSGRGLRRGQLPAWLQLLPWQTRWVDASCRSVVAAILFVTVPVSCYYLYQSWQVMHRLWASVFHRQSPCVRRRLCELQYRGAGQSTWVAGSWRCRGRSTSAGIMAP